MLFDMYFNIDSYFLDVSRMAANELEVVVMVPQSYLQLFDDFIKYTQLTPGMMEVKLFLRALMCAHEAQIRRHVTVIFRDQLTVAGPPFPGTHITTQPKFTVQDFTPQAHTSNTTFPDRTLLQEEQKQYNRQIRLNNLGAPFPTSTRRAAARNYAYRRSSSSEEGRQIGQNSACSPRFYTIQPLVPNPRPRTPQPDQPIRRNTPPASPDPIYESELEEGEIRSTDTDEGHYGDEEANL